MATKNEIVNELITLTAPYFNEVGQLDKFNNEMYNFPICIIQLGEEDIVPLETSNLFRVIPITFSIFEKKENPQESLYNLIETVESNVVNRYCQNTNLSGIIDFIPVSNEQDGGVLNPFSSGLVLSELTYVE